MELKKALELQVEHYGRDGSISVDVNGYICLNDLHAYYPHKRLQDWLDNGSTKELIAKVGQFLISAKESELDSTALPAVIARRGRHKSGTWAHELVAMDFATWLSVEFKLAVYEAYINGTQHKKGWNIKRVLAAFNYKMLTEAIHDAHAEPKPYHYSNEALMLNEIVFGVREGAVRDTATEAQLDMVAALEADNATMIKLGMEYDERKKHLAKFFAANTQKKLTA